MRALALASLILVLVLVSLAAYLRLDHSGIGCEPWPACYGNIGEAVAENTPQAAIERLVDDTRAPPSWATPAHRLVASVLGLLIVALCLMSFFLRRDRIISVTLLALTVFLAVLGIRSGELHSPAVVMGNLAGGFAMLGLLGWLVLKKPRDKYKEDRVLRRWSVAALFVICLQIALGGLTSANFAASACQTLPDCHGSWLPGTDLVTAFDLSRVHQIGDTGMVIGGAERADVQKLHRLVALLAVGIVLTSSWLAFKSGHDLRIAGIAAAVLVTLEFLVGVSAIAFEIPIALAVAHNSLAALLLLVTLKMLAEVQSGGASQLSLGNAQ